MSKESTPKQFPLRSQTTDKEHDAGIELMSEPYHKLSFKERAANFWEENRLFVRAIYILTLPALALFVLAYRWQPVALTGSGRMAAVGGMLMVAALVPALLHLLLIRNGSASMTWALSVIVGVVVYTGGNSAGFWGGHEETAATEAAVAGIVRGRLIQIEEITPEKYGRYAGLLEQAMSIEWQRVAAVSEHIEAFESLDLPAVAMVGDSADSEIQKGAARRLKLAAITTAGFKEGFANNPGPTVLRKLPIPSALRVGIARMVKGRSEQRLHAMLKIIKAEETVVLNTIHSQEMVSGGHFRRLDDARARLERSISLWRWHCDKLLTILDADGKRLSGKKGL